MDNPSSSSRPKRALTGRRVRKVPATPRLENKPIPTVGTSQPLETSGGGLYSRIIKEAMGRINRAESEAEEMNSSSSESPSEDAELSDNQTFSSSLGLSSEDESETEVSMMGRSPESSDGSGSEELNRIIEEEAAAANREIREIERQRKGKAVETRENEEPKQTLPGAGAGEPQRDPIRDIIDLTETNDEENAAPDEWRKRMEETVKNLVETSATQNALLESHREQITTVVGLIDSLISCMKGTAQPSHRLSPPAAVTGQSHTPRVTPGAILVGESSRRKHTATTKDSALKRARWEIEEAKRVKALV